MSTVTCSDVTPEITCVTVSVRIYVPFAVYSFSYRIPIPNFIKIEQIV